MVFTLLLSLAAAKKMLPNAFFFAQFVFDTAENELAKKIQKFATFLFPENVANFAVTNYMYSGVYRSTAALAQGGLPARMDSLVPDIHISHRPAENWLYLPLVKK